MTQMFSPEWPDLPTLQYMLLGAAGLVGFLLAATIVAVLFMLPMLLFVPWRGRPQIQRDGVEQLERLGFPVVEHHR